MPTAGSTPGTKGKAEPEQAKTGMGMEKRMEMEKEEGKAETMQSIEAKRREPLQALGETPPLGAPMRVFGVKSIPATFRSSGR
ncbi:hypothetical protein FE782_25785 [Paenibacillus antri]|uniref:Uncharacterized protein n=1 Tax=Paenibacillus antri TaxID=2582848 RepID=A0A5R9FYY8_9BACL|nr:hypothetical protein FE782_25785 [Paenibacillus antri]